METHWHVLEVCARDTHSACSLAGCCPGICPCRCSEALGWGTGGGLRSPALRHCWSCRRLRCLNNCPSLRSCCCRCCSSARWSPPPPAALRENEMIFGRCEVIICSQCITNIWRLKAVRQFELTAVPPLLMSSSCGSGDGLSLLGDVFTPPLTLVGVRNWDAGWLALTDCCSIRAWILLLPSALTQQHGSELNQTSAVAC